MEIKYINEETSRIKYNKSENEIWGKHKIDLIVLIESEEVGHAHNVKNITWDSKTMEILLNSSGINSTSSFFFGVDNIKFVDIGIDIVILTLKGVKE